MIYELTIVTVFVVLGALYAQKKHYDFLVRRESLKAQDVWSSDVQDQLKDLDLYKKKVDALTIRAGFKA